MKGSRPSLGVGRSPTLTGCSALVLLIHTAAGSHERFTDPVLAELNDCLMAVQILRFQDDRARELLSLPGSPPGRLPGGFVS